MAKPMITAAAAQLAALFCAAGLRAEEELSPVDTIQLLEQVEALRGKVDEGRYGIHAASIQAYRNAAQSPSAAYEFYLKCYREVKFDRREARESEYRDWKSKNAQWLRSKEHSEARRLQLEYLMLTLRVAQMSKPEEIEGLVPELTRLIDTCIARSEDVGKGGRDILREDAIGSIYGQVYHLPSSLKHLRQWGEAPLDIEGIYERAILPLYRSESRAADLATAWDHRIAQQTRLIGTLGNEEAEERFTKQGLPLLRWQKNMDLLRAGQRKTALRAMVELVGKHLDHEEIDRWLAELAGLLKGEQNFPTFEDEELRRRGG